MAESRADRPGTTLGALDLGVPTVVSESDSLESVGKTFVNLGTSCAVLAEPPLRVVTERDLVIAWSKGKTAEDKVALVASGHPYWASASTTVAAAAALMVNLGIRHLVVLDASGQPTGVVSMSELFTVLVHSQEPLTFYESFAAVITRKAQP